MTRSGRSHPVRAHWDGGFRATVTVRGFTFVVDEPEAAGGTDDGPMPTEYLLGALASCYALAIAWAAGRGEVRLGELDVHATGEYDGQKFATITLEVHSDLPDDVLEPLLRSADRVCYVSRTLGTGPEVTVVRA